MIPRRSKSLLIALFVTASLAPAAHAQSTPGIPVGGLTVTLPTAEGAASSPTHAISHMGAFDPSIARVWFQAFVLPGWRFSPERVTQPSARASLQRRAARTR
jgi:hypothetical protein